MSGEQYQDLQARLKAAHERYLKALDAATTNAEFAAAHADYAAAYAEYQEAKAARAALSGAGKPDDNPRSDPPGGGR